MRNLLTKKGYPSPHSPVRLSARSTMAVKTYPNGYPLEVILHDNVPWTGFVLNGGVF